jgi:hypothetical protein
MLLTLFALAGCNSSDGFARAPVKGQVTVAGQPLAEGVIRFIPDKAVAGQTVQAVVKNGEYELDRTTGPVAGKYRVEVEATGYLPFAFDDDLAHAAYIKTHGRLPQQPIPPQYNLNSTLSAEIPADGAENLNYDLIVK